MPKYAVDLNDAGVIFRKMQVIADFFYEKPGESEGEAEKEINRLLSPKRGIIPHHASIDYCSAIEDEQNS